MSIIGKEQIGSQSIHIILSRADLSRRIEDDALSFLADMIANKIMEKGGDELVKLVSQKDIVEMAKSRLATKLADKITFKIKE